MTSAAEGSVSPEKRIRELEKENQKLRKKVARLKKTMDITTKHSDVVTGELEEKVEASIREVEERVRMISETIPVPVIIARISDGKIRYVNEHSCRVFEYELEEFSKQKASILYENPDDRQSFINALSKQGQVSNFEVRLKKKNGKRIWADLFSQPLYFKNEPCALTVLYDLTERRKAEDEIRKLRARLDDREIKHLLFELDGTEYGIDILKVREIVSMMPISPVPNMPPHIRGVINLRGKVIPVTELRIRLGLEPAAHTERTCIIVTEIGEGKDMSLTGLIVDAVSDVRGIRAGDIEPASGMMLQKWGEMVSGIAKSGEDIKLLINCACLEDGASCR